jgi:hypothetical protein
MRDKRQRGRYAGGHDPESTLVPEASSTPPDKPESDSEISIPVKKVKVIVETCSCGASISVPIEAYGVRELVADWRTTHHHSTSVTPVEPADRAPDRSTGAITPATGSFLAANTSRSFGFSAE